MRMVTMWVLLVAAFPLTAMADAENRVQPALYASVSFGGSGGLRDARFGARVDPAQGPATAGAPALVQWEYRAGGSELAVAGLPLVATGRLAPVEAAESGQDRAARIAATSVMATAVIGGLAVWALSSLMEDFGEGFGDAMGEAAVDNMFGSSEDETPPPPCDGVEVVDNCVGNGG